MIAVFSMFWDFFNVKVTTFVVFFELFMNVFVLMIKIEVLIALFMILELHFIAVNVGFVIIAMLEYFWIHFWNFG